MKKLIGFLIVAVLVGCNCWTQIPSQYLPANLSCEAYLPNYLEYVSVINNCGMATLTQEPPSGTILDIVNLHIEVTLTATNVFGNTDVEKFDVYLWDAPEIIWDSIPGDTIPAVARRNDIDLLIESVEEYRAYLGIVDTNTVVWKTIPIYYPPK